MVAVAPAVAPTMAPGVARVPTDEYGNEINPVRYVGDKTFVLHGGVWTDTTFDPDKMEAVAVGFGSDDYFALLANRPDWGRYLALGDHVIVVLDGTAYEVRTGNPFKKYTPLDFDVSQPPLLIQVSGARLLLNKHNVIQIEVQRGNFKLAITGFDVNRDLRIKTNP